MSKYSNKSTIERYKNAFNGIKILFHSEHSIKRMLFITSIGIITAILLKFNPREYCMLGIIITINFLSEFFNSTIEYTHDEIFKEKYSEIAKKAKDMAAGGVMFSLIMSLIVSSFLYIPKILHLFY